MVLKSSQAQFKGPQELASSVFKGYEAIISMFIVVCIGMLMRVSLLLLFRIIGFDGPAAKKETGLTKLILQPATGSY